MAMTQMQMQSAIKSLSDSPNMAIKFMQKTHASDHVTPTHTRPGGLGDIPKSFYMKLGTVGEQQGTRSGTVGWGGKQGEVANMVNVPGHVPVDVSDEAAIARMVLKAPEYLLIDASDDKGGKFLMVTAIPGPYRGFSFTAGNALPQKVHMNVVVIRAATNTKVLSTYPADGAYVASRPGARYTIA